MNVIEGKLDASGLKFAIVISRFNEFITNKLLAMGMTYGYSRIPTISFSG